MKEYFVWTETGDGNLIGVDELDDMAKEGWDLLCVVPTEEKTYARFIFAREKKDGEN